MATADSKTVRFRDDFANGEQAGRKFVVDSAVRTMPDGHAFVRVALADEPGVTAMAWVDDLRTPDGRPVDLT